MVNKSRVWSIQLVSFLVGLRTYQHPLLVWSTSDFHRRFAWNPWKVIFLPLLILAVTYGTCEHWSFVAL